MSRTILPLRRSIPRFQPLGAGGYGLVDTAVVIILMFVFAVIIIDRYQATARAARESAIKAELTNMRQSILLFRLMKGRYPKELSELVTTEYVAPFYDGGNIEATTKPVPETAFQFKRPYIEPHAVDRDKNILDPFGNPYAYSAINGTVHSITKGFEEY